MRSRWRSFRSWRRRSRLLARVGDDYLPSADQAWIELQIRDIGHHSVLLGPYSRFGWFHPGPLLYYLLWLPYRITGSSGAEPRRRRAHAQRGRARRHRARGQAARRAPAPAADPVPERAPDLVAGPAVLPRTCGTRASRSCRSCSWCSLAWSMSCGEAWALPVGAGVATFLVQTHVSYGFTTAAVAGRRPRRRGDHGVATTCATRITATACARGCAWAGSPSPCSSCCGCRSRSSSSPSHPATSARSCASSVITVASTATATRGTWWRRNSAHGPTGCAADIVRNIYSGAVDLSGPTPIAIVALVLVGAAALTWRRAKDGFRFDVIVGLAIVAGFVSVSRIVGEIFPYLVIWTWALGMLAWLAIGWSVARWWQTRAARRRTGGPRRARRRGRRVRGGDGGEHGRRRPRGQSRRAGVALGRGIDDEGA